MCDSRFTSRTFDVGLRVSRLAYCGVRRGAERRAGFTLVELMVAMTLTLFIMAILSQAFVTSLETFSKLKGVADMQLNLRTASLLLRNDLQMDHFEGERRLSDPDILRDRPREGFFFIAQGGAKVFEGTEIFPSGNVPSYRATNHMLYFTIRNTGNKPENYFAAKVSPTSPLLTPKSNFFGQPTDGLFQTNDIFRSQWAEVAYFLVQKGSTEEPANPAATSGTPLFALYRSLYLLTPDPSFANTSALPASEVANHISVSCYPNPSAKLIFNSPASVIDSTQRTLDVSIPPARKGQSLIPAAVPPPSGSALVMSNVVSFQVEIFRVGGSDFEDLPTVPGTFDAASSNYSIQALRIHLRIWDNKTKQARQVTLIENL